MKDKLALSEESNVEKIVALLTENSFQCLLAFSRLKISGEEALHFSKTVILLLQHNPNAYMFLDHLLQQRISISSI